MRHLSTSLVLAAAAAAQSPPPVLIAPTLNTPLIAQADHATCSTLLTCPITPTLLPSPNFYWAGGSAWDSFNTALWVTTGTQLARFGMNGCTVQCGPIPVPKSSPIAEATGMDMHDGNNQLWVIDSQGWITVATSSCPPSLVTSYNTGLAIAGNVVTSAIAIDELRGLVFYSTCDFGAGSGLIYVAQIATPGAPFQAPFATIDCLPVPVLITGLACDASRGELYWTNGRGTHRVAYNYNPAGPSVVYGLPSCCLQTAPFPDPFTDLSIRWAGATSTGTPCANGACAPCPMVHSLRNAPLLGTILQLGLDQTQPSTLALCGVDFGSCATTGPVLPPFCGPLLLPLTAALLVLGPNIPVGPGPCNASTTFFLPLPSNPAFAGIPLASQCVSLCAPSGTAMSNCLSFVLQ